MMPRPPIRVLLVEDSPVALLILKRIFASCPDIEVVGTAHNGKEALSLIPELQPNVICTDYYMPQMNGLEFTKEVMSKFPKPILVISASVQKENTQNIFKMLDAGAVDVFPKPRAGLAADYELIKQDLINRIRILSGVAVFTRRPRESVAVTDVIVNKVNVPTVQPIANNIIGHKIETSLQPVTPVRSSKIMPRIVAIGASTGGPQALHSIISQLPDDFPVPIICVQHISDGFLQGLVDWLASESRLKVKIANIGELPQRGNIYFPAERRHLELNCQGRFVHSATPPVGGHCPSVTVTFKSIASFYGRAALGILLTGMGRDGADGMQAIFQAGGITIAQDEASSVVFGMPKEAIALGVVQHILPVTSITPYLLNKIFPSKPAFF